MTLLKLLKLTLNKYKNKPEKKSFKTMFLPCDFRRYSSFNDLTFSYNSRLFNDVVKTSKINLNKSKNKPEKNNFIGLTLTRYRSKTQHY